MKNVMPSRIIRIHRAISSTLALIAPICGLAVASGAAASGVQRANINGIDYGYEIRGAGAGAPLLLLHGGLLSFDVFEPVMPLFKDREVILVDLQGHGRTTLGDRPIRCEPMADDIDALLEKLGRTQVDVLGYSFGGGVALRLAIQHPDRVRRLVLVSTPYANHGWYAEMIVQQKEVGAAMAPMIMETPMYHTYKAVAPRLDDFPRLLDAMGDFMRQTYDWSAEVAKLPMPVLLVYGDADMVRPEHIVKFYQLLGGGLKDAGWNREHMPKNRLAILPDLTHYEAFATSRVTETVLPFLNSGSASWSAGAASAKSPE